MVLQYVRRELSDPRRQRLYREAILIAVAGNVLLAATKGAVARFSGSSAVLSDAANSLSDTLYSLMMAAWTRTSEDRALPGTAAGRRIPIHSGRGRPKMGHSRFEPLVSLLIVAAMGAGGRRRLKIGFHSDARGCAALYFGRGADVDADVRRLCQVGPQLCWWAWTQTSEDSVVVKVVMFLWVGRIGRLAHGPAIDASARDNVDADVRRSG